MIIYLNRFVFEIVIMRSNFGLDRRHAFCYDEM